MLHSIFFDFDLEDTLIIFCQKTTQCMQFHKLLVGISQQVIACKCLFELINESMFNRMFGTINENGDLALSLYSSLGNVCPHF